MTDAVVQDVKLKSVGYTNIILPGAKSGARRDSFITAKINQLFENDAHINASTNHRSFQRNDDGGVKIADFAVEAPTVRIAMFNSMSQRGGSDLMFAKRIAEAMQWGRDQGRVSGDFNIELIPTSSQDLDHRLQGEARDRDLAYVDDYHHVLSDMDAADIKADAWIVTGAVPRESNLAQETFWPDMQKVITHTRDTECAALFSCLASQAYLHEVYGVDRFKRQKDDGSPDPLYGHYEQDIIRPNHPIMHGVVKADKPVIFPVSRGWQTDERQILDVEKNNKRFNTLASFPEGGASIISDHTKGAHLLLTSHPEYDVNTLRGEYVRNVGIDPNAAKPVNYDVQHVENNADVYADQPRLIFNALSMLLKKAMRRHDALNAGHAVQWTPLAGHGPK